MDGSEGRNDDQAEAVSRAVGAHVVDARDVVAADLRCASIRRHAGDKEPLQAHLPTVAAHEIGNRATDPVTGRQTAQQGLIASNHQEMTSADQRGCLIQPHQTALDGAHAASGSNWRSSWTSMRSFLTK